MKVRQFVLGAMLVAATALVTSQVVSQDNKTWESKDKSIPAMTPEQQAEMAKWMEFATPGPNHALLQKKVGRWNGELKHWMEPGTEPKVSKCTSDVKAIFDGRYFEEVVEGEGMMPGETFLGKSVLGYDNLKKKFFWSWVDNMGTGVMYAEGNYDPTTKTFKYTYDYPDCNTGKYVKGRSTDKWIDDNKIVGEMYGWDKAGKEFKMMEITFTRAK